MHSSNKTHLLCVLFSAGGTDPNSQDSLNLEEKRRQGSINELIETEERYVEDLKIVLEVMAPAQVAV